MSEITRGSEYGWEGMTDGEWHLVREGDPTVFGHAAYNTKARNAAYRWAGVRGMRIRTVARDGGARYYIQFTQGLAPFKDVEAPA